MKIRRIVTGLNGQGKALIQSDTRLEREFASLPGFSNTLLWATDGVPEVGVGCDADPVPAVTSYMPGPGGTRLMIVALPPDASMGLPGFDPAAYGAEVASKVPGFGEAFEIDAPGMHTTDTVDYGVLLDGEVWLELDDGREVKVEPRDVVVQNGTRHAWRNKGDRQATLLFVLVGAQRRR